ncbi:hypothetical protein K470DRAFT_15200 [Piedraia hortae CBS 480.64]|uniref:RecQ-mediated genome instability protein 1 n=1 Tax=Piedraia hortae CBS 480.64 TaxID=1314780 RepID=A0A6A7C5A2_9PEZI|nr:hypothetical protein K470DRAFT_15200 [Piedraia hortae CBS 480.64]
MSSDGAELASQITEFLASKQVPPNGAWMQMLMQGIRADTPLVGLRNTALFRILASDLQTSVRPSLCFPANVTDATAREKSVRGPVTVQVLDVEDIGRSRWSQVEAIEAAQRGEVTRGREIIPAAPDEHDETPALPSFTGPHKLLLQDAKGVKAYALELAPVNKVGVDMAIGSKFVLRNFTVARGLLLLEPCNVEYLGGKVDAWHQKWKDDRLGMLKEKANMGNV